MAGKQPSSWARRPAGLERRLSRALDALGELPDNLQLPGLDDLADELIALADAVDGDAEDEPETDLDGEEENLPLFSYAVRVRPP